MPELYDYDDRTTSRRYDRNRNASSSLLVTLLLIPIAFLAGWIVNAYTGNDNLNRVIPGTEVGVGGGPETRPTVTPLPTSGPTNPSITPIPTEGGMVSPTTQPTTPAQ